MKSKEKKPLNMKRQWLKFAIVTILYLLFLLWVGSWLGLIVLPFIYDAYITKKIKWQWWKERDGAVRTIMSWVDAIVFALVAVYFINQFFFQNYVIPSSSLEKSLLRGDYLFVSKLSYGPRIPQTPLTMPLTQHTLPFFGMKSYIEWPHWDYRRVKGLGHVELNDIVVFNYPEGDTICTELPFQTRYYELVYEDGLNAYAQQAGPLPTNMSEILDFPDDTLMTKDEKILRRLRWFSQVYAAGRQIVDSKKLEYGDIATRPTDRRENYVKRCVGLPGQTLEIKDHIIYLDGKPNKEPDNVQYAHRVRFKQGAFLSDEFMKENGITCEDLGYSDGTNRAEDGVRVSGEVSAMPLTKQAKAALERSGLVESIELNTDPLPGDWVKLYPHNGNTHWTRDNYGPIWIPKKGATIDLTLENYAIYERPIRTYEGNKLEIKNGQIYINDKQTTKYTFKMDYYWMMGDNRHNSADSRYWGFVPEDHIVGKPIFIWWSSDPDRSWFSGIRWNRLFRFVDNIK